MATIHKRTTSSGKTRYQAKVRLKGRPSLSATFDRKTDARAWAQEVETDLRRERYLPSNEARRKTLGDLVDRYVTDVIPTKRTGGKKDTALLSWWKIELGSFYLADVSPAMIAESRDKLARGVNGRGKRRSNGTVNRYLAAISHAFTLAVKEWGWVGENPVRKVRRLEEPRGRVRCLTNEERERLLDACRRSNDKRLYPLVVLALSTGARQGEILSLKWSDISLDRQVAVLNKTKNRERRAIPLVGEAIRVVADLGKVRRIDTDKLFVSSRGSTRFPQKAWEKALKDAEIDDFRFHDLRHSAASYLAMSGATLAELAEILGHKTLQMVKRYSHLTEQHTSQVVERMNKKYLAGKARGRS